MTPAHIVVPPKVPNAAPAAWIGPDLVTGEGIVSVDVTFLVREALGEAVPSGPE